MNFSYSDHEGLTLNYDSCNFIIDFLESKIEIRNELFNFRKSVEEFVLQTIVANFSYFYVIGNGIYTPPDDEIINLPKEKFVYKTLRI